MKKKLNMTNETLSYRLLYYLGIIILSVLALIWIIPFWYVLINSLRPGELVQMYGMSIWPERIDFSAYTTVFTGGSILLRGYEVSILVTAVGTLSSMLLSTIFAYAVSKRISGMRPMLIFAFIGASLPIGLMPFYIYMVKIGMLNSFWSMILPELVALYNVFLLKTYFESGNTQVLEEAATIDGASELQVFWKVVIPMSLPIIATVSLFYGVGYWNTWYSAAIFISDPQWYPAQLVVNQIINGAEQISSMANNTNIELVSTESLKMAALFLLILPVFAAYPFVQKYFVHGIMIGAIKE